MPTVFTENRQRVLDHEVGAQFLHPIVLQARGARLMSTEHFSVDGTLIESWASLESFRPKDDDDDDNEGRAARRQEPPSTDRGGQDRRPNQTGDRPSALE